ncbi:multidrug efflux SMR transporter [Georgenia sp. 10Sc9-8]|uniref:Multidrug efflux SMR transporter n=1 Tax=Georgenia halotolerans TaxID=3028317 RepID=A0ABT5TTR4_9MICO|nr:multidrug efflux SMR transporter [Georgenia halotolerans]
MAWTLLVLAIAAEVAGTSVLPRTDGFRRAGPTAAVLGLYALALFLLAQSLRVFEVGVAYALWAGLGTAAVAVIGMGLLGERRSVGKVAGLGLVIAGAVLLNLAGTS